MTNQQTNQFTNYKKIIDLADENWRHAEHCKISNLNVEVEAKNYLRDQFGRSFHHFCTTSYLGLDYHPLILAGAVSAIQNTETLRIPNSKNRCKLKILDIDSILYLKDRYGMFVYLDDSHSISATGNKGAGFIRSNFR